MHMAIRVLIIRFDNLTIFDLAKSYNVDLNEMGIVADLMIFKPEAINPICLLPLVPFNDHLNALSSSLHVMHLSRCSFNII